MYHGHVKKENVCTHTNEGSIIKCENFKNTETINLKSTSSFKLMRIR